jgi:hypothetical protein
MGIYKGTQALSLNGANGADGTNGLNGGCTAIYYYNASINSVEGTNEANPGPNSVSGRYNVVGGLGATIDGGEGNFACGWGASVSGAQGNSAFGYNTQVTHASQGCHVEGYGNWLKAAQGAHMEGYENAVAQMRNIYTHQTEKVVEVATPAKEKNTWFLTNRY